MAKITIELDDELIARLIAGAQVLHAAVVPAQDEPEAAGEALPDRDSAGLPWDARIHSDSRARNSDGTWRKRRGVDQALVEAVTRELTAQGGEAGGAVEQDSPPALTVGEVGRHFDVPPMLWAALPEAGGAVEQNETPAVPPPPPWVEALAEAAPLLVERIEAPPPVAAAPTRSVSDITLAVATGRVLLADLVALCAETGVSGVHELASNPGALSLVVVSALEARGVWSE